MCVRVVNALLVLCVCLAEARSGKVTVFPNRIDLSGSLDRVRTVVWATGQSGLQHDLTTDASYAIANERIAVVSDSGIVTPTGNGVTTLSISVDQQEIRLPVTVSEFAANGTSSFSTEVVPVLTKLGCNSGGCHGKAEGQAGFRLSVFGFDAAADHEALVKQNRGRRVNRVWPEASLLLGKATNSIPHGGGQRTTPDSIYYRAVHNWLSDGAMFDNDATNIESISVQPDNVLLSVDARHHLRVVASFADGTERDVTHLADFQSNTEDIAAVTKTGLVTGQGIAGEAAILVRFLEKLDVCQVTLPQTDTEFVRPMENNIVDRHVWDKLARLGIQPSDPADDATFFRRVHLDTTGTLPTAAEARRFLEDADPQKRTKLINKLLQSEEYAIYQALRWSDVLRLDSNALGAESAVAFTRWLRQQVRDNRPYDAFVRDILTAKGNTRTEGPAALYLTLNKPTELGSSVSQLFLGVRIECAECHHHPFEKWSQSDFYGFAGLFTGIGLKNLPGGAKAVTIKTGNDLKHRRSNESVRAKGLGQSMDSLPAAESEYPRDRREVLADWLTSRDNPFFARAIVNRVWAGYFERGLIDPVDDLRATNPASNESLMAALSDHLCEHDFDLKDLTRLILNSQTYQLSSVRNDTNANDRHNFSGAAFRPVPAEVLMDAISTATGIPEKFNGWPVGARAIEVWDNRMPSYFFRIFGRPTRTTVCACERGDAPSISQALHLLNSPEISRRIRHRHGTARRLAESDLSPAELLDELYLATVCRLPKENEKQLMLAVFEDTPDRREAVEDLLWTLMNTKEFLFNH